MEMSGPRELEITRLTGPALDKRDAKDSHTLDRCVRLIAHDDAYVVHDGRRCLRPEGEWGEVAPGHNKNLRNAKGLPLHAEYYPFCPWSKKRIEEPDGSKLWLELRDY